MKLNQIFSASLLAGAVLLSGTACAASIPEGRNTPVPSSSASAEPSQTTSEDSATDNTAKILTTVNGYYDFITDPESPDKIKSAGDPLVGKAATDEEMRTFAEDFSEGFQYFDTSTSDLIRRSYKSMSLGSLSLTEQGSITISAPEESVTIDGDTATVNTTWISATKNGKKLRTAPESSPDASDLIQLVKKDDGSWVIVPSSSMPKPTVP